MWWWILCAGVGLWILPEEEFLSVFALRGFLYLKSLAIVTEFGIVERGTWITAAAPQFRPPALHLGRRSELRNLWSHVILSHIRCIMDQLLSKSFKHNAVKVIIKIFILHLPLLYQPINLFSLVTLYSPMANLTWIRKRRSILFSYLYDWPIFISIKEPAPDLRFIKKGFNNFGLHPLIRQQKDWMFFNFQNGLNMWVRSVVTEYWHLTME